MIKKLGLLPYQDTAVSYYRMIGPAESMIKIDLLKKLNMFPFSGAHENHTNEWTDKTYMEIGKDADAIWSTLLWNIEDMTRVLNLRKWSGAKVIIDLDDNLYNIPRDNPASRKAQLMKQTWETCLRMADGVTVSVPMLKKLYAPLNKNIYVNPNGLDLDFWSGLNVKKNESTKIRIGWRGAAGHRDDLALVLPALEALKKDYDIELVVLGSEKPDYPCEYYPPVEFRLYPQMLASLGVDIAIVPLIDSSYNRCKSNLAWLEWSALKVPVVLSPTENQKDVPALQANNNFEWFEKLEQLIKNKALRKTQAIAQYNFLKTNYRQEKLVPELAEWIQALPYRTDLEP